jgi:hypothetical protein
VYSILLIKINLLSVKYFKVVKLQIKIIKVAPGDYF